MKLGYLALLGAFAVAPFEPPEVGFDVLAGFDYEEGMELPAEVTQYHEQKVKVNGFMRREDGGIGPTEYFMLINEACGCDGTPKMNEIVFCTMPSGEEAKIDPNTVTVTGTLYVEEYVEDEIVISIYTLDVESLDT